MKKKFWMAGLLPALLLTGALFTSCNDDDDNDPNQSRSIKVKNVTTVKDFVQSGTFEGAANGGLIMPGEQIELTFNAGKGQYLSLATMYGNSKDLFFAPENPGIMLFDAGGNPVTGDVSGEIKLWDNGTLSNIDPTQDASGQNSVVQDDNIREIAGNDGTYPYPSASDMMKLTLAYDANKSEFRLTILNNTNTTAVQTPFSPGVWAVSNILEGRLVNETPFYVPGEKTTSELTALATMGNNQPLINKLTANTGIITGLSPVLVVIYTGTQNPIFEVNQRDGGVGLKNLAQTGDASVLKASLERERLVRKVFVLGTGPIAPGKEVEGHYEAMGTDKIAFATMFGYSNDWFYSNNSVIDATNKGDKTNQVSLYDDGTAFSQYPGAGNAQAGFTNRAIAEDQPITLVDLQTYPQFPVPAVSEMIHVTID